MKISTGRGLILLLLAITLLIPYGAMAAASSAQVEVSPVTGKHGGELVAINGSTEWSQALNVYVFKPDGTKLFVDVVVPEEGSYATSFVLPSNAPAGSYTVSVGRDTEVATTVFKVFAAPASSGSDGSVTGDPAQVKVTEKELAPTAGGQVVLTLHADARQLVLPANSGELLKGNELLISQGGLKLAVKADLLKELADLTTSGKGKIVLSLHQLDAANLAPLLSSSPENDHLQSVGLAFQFDLTIEDEQGKAFRLDKFKQPIVLAVPLDSSSPADADLLGVYYHNPTTAKWEYVGGDVQSDGRQLTVPLPHFSTFAVMAYEESYQDVPDTHWAYSAIRFLTARHVTAGVSEDLFVPNRRATRAEFTALLTRALMLGEDEGSAFADVSADAWYAGAVYAAYKEGLVSGQSPTAFAPNAPISRQEMAVMLVKAYQIRLKSAAAGSDAAEEAEAGSPIVFRDAGQIGAWAKQSVAIAAQAGLLVGQGDQRFHPRAEASRAETTQAIANLLKLTRD